MWLSSVRHPGSGAVAGQGDTQVVHLVLPGQGVTIQLNLAELILLLAAKGNAHSFGLAGVWIRAEHQVSLLSMLCTQIDQALKTLYRWTEEDNIISKG